jgi:acyl-homoserine lactone acylase PvdQ
MSKKKKEYVYIFNFETSTIDCLSLENRPKDIDAEQFIEQTLDYNLSSCNWMVVDKKLKINYLN